MNHSRRDIDEWMRLWSSDQQEQVRWLADRVRSAVDGMEEAMKWGRLTFTTGGDWHHWLCSVSVTRRTVNLLFHKGSLLDDPAGLLEGNGRYLRQLPYDRAAGQPDAVSALVRQAVRRQQDLLA